MNWNFYMASALMKHSLLVMMFFLVGCQTTPTTQTAETERNIAASTCKVWVPVTYSSQDTEQTRLEIRANNAARAAFCANH